MKLKIETTQDDFNQAYEILDGTRPSSKEIKVPRELFRKLLFDHSILHEAVEKYLD